MIWKEQRAYCVVKVPALAQHRTTCRVHPRQAPSKPRRNMVAPAAHTEQHCRAAIKSFVQVLCEVPGSMASEGVEAPAVVTLRVRTLSNIDTFPILYHGYPDLA
jgi:hypothetical protein